MASLFEIGKTGVQAYRQALSVTGQNIANINTDGYNKRRADVSEVAGVTGGPTNVSDQSGLGVRVTNVRRSFDAYLADKSRTSQSDYEMLNDFVSKLSDLENMLLPSGSDLGVFIGRFFDTLQDVASNPDSLSARAVSLEAGKALAYKPFRIIFKHILPNVIGPLIVISAANFAAAILIEAGLSFLGFGAQPPIPTWGGIIKDHYAYIIMDKAYLAIIPGLAIMSLVLAFMLLGNGLRDAFDVKD